MSCSLPGCGKATWNGLPGYCSKIHKQQGDAFGIIAGAAVCYFPLCGKATWNGLPGYCSKNHKQQGDAQGIVVPMPVRPPKLSGPSSSGRMCECGTPALTGSPFCSNSCKEYRTVLDKLMGIANNFGTKVDAQKHQELGDQLIKKWNGTAPPKVKEIWNVTKDTLVVPHMQYARKIGNCPCKGFGAQPGNMQRRFHCTKVKCSGWTGSPCTDTTCALCNIITNGFATKYANTGRFGPGLYSSSTPSKAYAYGDKRYLIVTSVVCGVSEYRDQVNGNDTSALDESKYNSRVITDTGGKADECIVYHDEAMIPRYLIVFDK